MASALEQGTERLCVVFLLATRSLKRFHLSIHISVETVLISYSET